MKPTPQQTENSEILVGLSAWCLIVILLFVGMCSCTSTQMCHTYDSHSYYKAKRK